MTLTPAQREALEALGDLTDDLFLQPQYARWLLPKLRDLADHGEPLTQDDAVQWAREREWSDLRAGVLAGIAWTIRYGFDPAYGEPLA